MDSPSDHNWRRDRFDRMKIEVHVVKNDMEELKKSGNVESNDKRDELKQKLNDLLQRMDDFINTVETREKEEMKSLFEKVESKEKELHLKIEKQKSEIQESRREIQEFKIEIQDLRSEIQELKRQIQILEGEKRIIELGQVTLLFEKYVAHFVLPKREKISYGCFKQMEKWLKDNAHTTEGTERQNIWTSLQLNSAVTWSKDHWNAIKVLKEMRNPLAHPPVNLTQAKQDIAVTIPHLEDEYLDIIKMVEKLNSLIVMGKLACEFEDKVIQVVCPGAKMDIAGLINWIKVNGASEQGKERRERWMELNNKTEWTKKHEEALGEMKLLKRNVKDLQQLVELDEAIKHIFDYVPRELEKECSEIVDMMKQISIEGR